jgi:hypothetical protein
MANLSCNKYGVMKMPGIAVTMRLSEFTMRLSGFTMRLSEPAMRLSEVTMRFSEVEMRFSKLTMKISEPTMTVSEPTMALTGGTMRLSEVEIGFGERKWLNRHSNKTGFIWKAKQSVHAEICLFTYHHTKALWKSCA